MQSKEWDSIASNINFSLDADYSIFKKYLNKKSSILDFGCGYGRLVEELYNDGFTNIIGIDSSKELIKRGLRQNPDLNIQFYTGSIPFVNEKFDAVILCTVLTCIPKESERKFVLNEISRVLKKTGILIIIDFCKDKTVIFNSNIGIEMIHHSVNDMMNQLTSFKEIKTHLFQTKTMNGNSISALLYIGEKEE